MSYLTSPLQWAGSKQKALTHLLPVLERYGHNINTFVEPFIGAASVSLNFDAPNYVWADTNIDLILTYETLLRDIGVYKDYLHWCQVYFEYGFDYYYELRDRFNDCNKDMLIQHAAMFQYLNKHGFNGLCRYNQKGGFNVPRGTISKKPKQVPVKQCKALRERHCSNTSIIHTDFKDVFQRCTYEDNCLIYCDPPYVALTSDFKYTKDGFDLDDQRDLKRLAKDSKHTVIISNHYTEFTKELYKDADELIIFDVQRTISCKGSGRKKVQEVIAVYKGE